MKRLYIFPLPRREGLGVRFEKKLHTALFSSGSDGLIQIWDVGNGKNVGTIKGENYIIDIAISNDSQILVAFSRNAQNQQTIEVCKQD